jgi:uncharacterized protein (TIGR02246 family)
MPLTTSSLVIKSTRATAVSGRRRATSPAAGYHQRVVAELDQLQGAGCPRDDSGSRQSRWPTVIRCQRLGGSEMLRLRRGEDRCIVEFAEAVQHHLAAVTERDLDGYLATVHPDASLIMPNGRLIEDRDAVATFHRDWFDDPDWSWMLSPVRTTTAGDTGVALVAVEYHDVDGSGHPYVLTYLLSLTFAQADGGWLLLHDQNTLTS